MDDRVLARLRETLTADQPSIDARWLYDDAGSRAYERITGLPDYYPPRVEHALLVEHAAEIAAVAQARHLVELGSGASDRINALIAGGVQAGALTSFTAFDVNIDAAQRATQALQVRWQHVAFRAVEGDFTAHAFTAREPGPTMIAFLGGTIGNFTPKERAAFWTRTTAALDPGDSVLLGIDLLKSVPRLLAAYDDEGGVTAAFILNALQHVNDVTGGGFELDAWRYVASWDAANTRVDMRVRAVRPQRVRLPRLDLDLVFEAGDDIAMEISTKFTVDGMCAELAAAGLAVERVFVGRDIGTGDGSPGSDEDDFALLLARRP